MSNGHSKNAYFLKTILHFVTAQGTTVIIIIERVQGPGAHIGQGLTQRVKWKMV